MISATLHITQNQHQTMITQHRTGPRHKGATWTLTGLNMIYLTLVRQKHLMQLKKNKM